MTKNGRSMLIVALLAMLLVTAVRAEVLPARGIDKGWKKFTGLENVTGVILCRNLTLRAKPSSSSKALMTIDGEATWDYRQSPLRIRGEEKDGWILVSYSDIEDGYGWVRKEYVLIDPAWYRAEKETAVMAYADKTVPRVALIGKGTILPIVMTMSGWYCVSMGGGTGWIAR